MSDWRRVCSLDEIVGGKPSPMTIDHLALVLVRVGDDVYCLRDECSHRDVPLSEGDVESCAIECYLHGSQFDLRTGEALNPPATSPVATYPVRIEGDEVLVDLTPSEEN